MDDNYEGNYTKSKFNMEKGIILEYIEDDQIKYLYTEKLNFKKVILKVGKI